MRPPARFQVVLASLLAVAGCFGGQDGPDEPGGETHAGGFSDHPGFPGDYEPRANHSMLLTPGPYATFRELVGGTPSRIDGVPIAIGVVLPEVPDGTRVPVIALAGPYIEAFQPGRLRSAHVDDPIDDFLVENFVSHGYAIAFVAARGVGDSGGCYTWWGADEIADLRQAVEWLATQPWSSGAVGAIGLSMTGAAAWEMAGGGNPALRTIVPIGSEADLYSWFVRNGTSGFTASGGTTAFTAIYQFAPEREATRQTEGGVCEDVARQQAANTIVTATSERDLLGEWATRDLRPNVESNYHGSVFLVHGLNDRLAFPHLMFPWIHTLAARGVEVKLLLGQWGHVSPDFPRLTLSELAPANPTRRVDHAEVLLHWFDYWLKDDRSVDLGPRVEVADSSNQWRYDHVWPPRDATATEFFLTAYQGLSLGSGGAAGTVRVSPDPVPYAYPIEEADCLACAEFRSAPLGSALRFAGLPQLPLTVVPQGPGGHVTAFLGYTQDGKWRPLTFAILDLRFADGGSDAQAVVPLAALVAKMEFEPVDAVIPEGAELTLRLSQTGSGVPPGQADPVSAHTLAYYRGSTPTYPVEVRVGGTDSKLVLRTFTVEPTRFFDAS